MFDSLHTSASIQTQILQMGKHNPQRTDNTLTNGKLTKDLSTNHYT
jgi:hypothetical protein